MAVGQGAALSAAPGAMAAPPPAPSPPVPPPVPEIPHLILGSLRYTLAWDVAASAFLLLVWFFGGRLESYWLSFATGDAATPRRPRHDDPGVATRRPPPRRRNARLRQLLAVWRASEEEVTSLCGADARDYLVVQRLLFLTLAAAAVPGACVLLPVAVALSARDASSGRAAPGAFDDASLFARTTVHHFPTKSPHLWLVVFVSVVTVCAVETASDAIDRHRLERTNASVALENAAEDDDENAAEDDVRPVRTTYDETLSLEESRDLSRGVERSTLLLRRLPRAVTKNPEALRRALNETFDDRTYAVVVPRDGAEARARRALGRARRALAATRRLATRRSAESIGTDLERIGSGSSPFPDGSMHERAVSLALSALMDAEDDLRRLLEVRRTKGAFVPNPGCAFVVFKDARAARAAERALQPTARGACVALLAPVAPERLIRAFAPLLRLPRFVSHDESNDASNESRPNDHEPALRVLNNVSVSVSEPRAVELAIRRGAHYWRCDFAPPPSGVLWENVGVTPGRRFLLTLLVNVCVSLGLVFVSSPLALFSYAGELAANLDPKTDWRWDAWLDWAKIEGGAYGGFVFQFAPNAAALVMIYLLIPRALERATRVEKHLTRSGALRSLVSKEFAYFLVNLLLLLALGKAALSAVVEQVRECQWHATPDACETKFLAVLGESFVAEAAMSLCGFLCTCCTLGPAWELLSVFAWIGEVAADAAETRRAAENADAFADAIPAPMRHTSDRGGVYTSRRTLLPSPFARLAARRASPRRPTFDLPGQHAFNATVLACAVAFASLAPALLVPGALFFAVRYLVHKHNLLCLHLGAVAGAGEGGDDPFGRPSSADDEDVANDESLASDRTGERTGERRIVTTVAGHRARRSDGKLLATVTRIVRVSALIHATVMAAFLRLRGTEAQAAAATALLVAAATRRRAAPLLRRAAKRARAAFSRLVAIVAQSWGGVPAAAREAEDEERASLERCLLSEARREPDVPPETLREAKRKYRGPSDDADEAAHELEQTPSRSARREPTW